MFITFEGPEGSGKTTQIALLIEYLRENGHQVLVTREPGGTAIGEQIRDLLHNVKNSGMSSVSEILLYSASRAQLVTELIRPHLDKGTIIICDRFVDSTLAYQGYGRGLSLDDLRTITRMATEGLKPDLTLLIDIGVERGLSRRQSGNVEMNRMDLQSVAFYERVRVGYQALVSAEPDRWVVIDGDRSIADIQTDIRAAIESRIASTEGRLA